MATYYTQKRGGLWIAADGVGMAATMPLDDNVWEICRVYVHPDQHGTGLGDRLLETAERHAIAHGATELVLWTDTRFRRAHAFYEKRSYLRRGPIRALDDIARSLEFLYAKPVAGLRRLDIAAAQSAERALASILVDCVAAGASVSFLAPLAPDRATAFWRDVTTAVGAGTTLLLVIWADATLAGTVQLVLNQSELGRHRAEIAKFLVHPGFRGRGLGETLLAAAETEAANLGRTLLLLDTKPGDDAERLYRRRAWQEIGRIEGYTRDAAGKPDGTVLFAKHLS